MAKFNDFISSLSAVFAIFAAISSFQANSRIAEFDQQMETTSLVLEMIPSLSKEDSIEREIALITLFDIIHSRHATSKFDWLKELELPKIYPIADQLIKLIEIEQYADQLIEFRERWKNRFHLSQRQKRIYAIAG